MIKILFVCHGNICRSPMAEFIMRNIVEKRGIADKFFIASAATSTEEIGNGVHRGTKMILDRLGIDSSGKRAVQLKRDDNDKYDFFIGMDKYNVKNMRSILGNDKPVKLMNFTGENKDVADPWYTGDFETTYADVRKGCEALMLYIEKYGLLYEKI